MIHKGICEVDAQIKSDAGKAKFFREQRHIINKYYKEGAGDKESLEKASNVLSMVHHNPEDKKLMKRFKCTLKHSKFLQSDRKLIKKDMYMYEDNGS